MKGPTSHEALDVDAVAGVGCLVELDHRQSQVRHIVTCGRSSPQFQRRPSIDWQVPEPCKYHWPMFSFTQMVRM